MNTLTAGTAVLWQGAEWVVVDIPNFDQAVLKHPITQRLQVASVRDITARAPRTQGERGLMTISSDQWANAIRRATAVQSVLSTPPGERTRELVGRIALDHGTSRATLYRWVKEWQSSETVSSLVRARRTDAGGSRLSQEIEDIIKEQIEAYYLTQERPTAIDLHGEFKHACQSRRLPWPGRETVRRRLGQLAGRLVMAKRESSKLAREKYEPLKGSFPGADVPGAVYQIDHSPIDVIFVDETYRRPINRGYMTIVIDCCTRMLAGFYVSLDPPGALATGLALSHAILPKDAWLAERDIDPMAKWPIHGLPAKVHADNAKEFRGTMLGRACAEYSIVMENRPKGLPNYGGRVERLFRTFMKRVQRLPGSTFSNVEERGEYDSEGRAIMTLKEFERWFTTFVTLVYHQRPHRGIGYVPPVKLYERFLLGTDTTMGIGLPIPIADPHKLRLDFMPFVERTIQEYGVRIDNIDYYADVLRPWIHAYDPKTPAVKRRFVFARDPRDIGEVYFFDPETRAYFTIPYRNLTHPRISLWELNAVRARLKEDSSMEVDEHSIFRGTDHMRRIEQEAAATSRKARRTQQRRQGWQEASAKGRIAQAAPDVVTDDEPEEELPIEPFEDIEQAP